MRCKFQAVLCEWVLDLVVWKVMLIWKDSISDAYICFVTAGHNSSHLFCSVSHCTATLYKPHLRWDNVDSVAANLAGLLRK